jgi:hypothetical protein
MGLGSWLGHYREWGPHFARFTQPKLENTMKWLELDQQCGAHTNYVWSNTFSFCI